MTWHQAKCFFAVMAAVCLLIAGVFTLAGFWLVLPFAGLEIALLGAALYHSARQAARREVVAIDERFVEITRFVPAPCRPWRCQRVWARVKLLPARVGWHPSKLCIRSHGKQMVVGDFLTESERKGLAVALRQLIEQPAA